MNSENHSSMTTRQTPDAVREATILAQAREAAAQAFDERAKKAGHPDTVTLERHHAKVIRQGEGDDYDAVQSALIALRLAALDSRAGSTTPKDTLVAYLRAIGFDTHAENVASGHVVLLPSYVALDLLAQPQSYAASPEEVRDRAQLLADVELHLKSSRVFITTREKMHPCGVELHDELLGRVTAAIDSIGKAKVHD